MMRQSAYYLGIPMLLQALLTASPAKATVFFEYGAEGEAVGDPLPNPDSGGGPNFWPYNDESKRGRVDDAVGAPEGSQYFQWHTVDSQSDVGNIVRDRDTFPITNLAGRTFYLAFYQRFDRVGGLDIWHDGDGTDSADKGVEIKGGGVRWVFGRGQWTTNNVPNLDHHWTVLAGNPSYHMNGDVPGCPNLEVHDNLPQNGSGYSRDNPIQLECMPS